MFYMCFYFVNLERLWPYVFSTQHTKNVAYFSSRPEICTCIARRDPVKRHWLNPVSLWMWLNWNNPMFVRNKSVDRYVCHLNCCLFVRRRRIERRDLFIWVDAALRFPFVHRPDRISRRDCSVFFKFRPHELTVVELCPLPVATG